MQPELTSLKARRAVAATAAAAIFGTAGVICVGTAPASSAPAGRESQRIEAPQRWDATGGVAGSLRSPNRHGLARVAITLTDNPIARALHRKGHQVDGRLSAPELAALRAGASGRRIAVRHERARREALGALDHAARVTARQQQRVARGIRRVGGRLLGAQLAGNSLLATIPAGQLQAVARLRGVGRVDPAPGFVRHGMETTTAAVGAPTWWAAGFLGGSGSADSNSADLAIIGDKLQEDHPVFAGQQFQRPPGAGVGTPCGGGFGPDCDHGTAVGSFAVSQGCGPALGCAAGDADELGVAPGPDTILDAADAAPSCGGGMDITLWALGIDAFGSGGCSGTLIPGADDPAETASLSEGQFEPGQEDTQSARTVDGYLNLGLVEAISAGNTGPAQSVATPCIAYNTLCTGAVDAHGTASQADDTVASFSARGPTPGGRKKPDIVAVGVPERYPNRRWSAPGQALFTSGSEGTSFAAPQVAGAATLLVGAGVADPLAVKAVLLNSARQPTPGWDPTWGWGELDLQSALTQRTNFQTGAAAPGAPRFFRATLQGPGDRATLTWNRRTTGCLGPGCLPNGLTLTNLDVSELSVSGTTEAASTSTVDNVEQVRSPAGSYPRTVIYKVRAASSVDGLPGEPFAITSARSVTALATPAPTVDLAVARPTARPGEDVTVTATVSNPSNDLTAENTQVTLQLPAEVKLAPSSAPASQPVGTLQPAGSAGSQATASWTVRGAGDQTAELAANAQATRFGETLAGPSDKAGLLIDGTPPSVTVTGPTGRTMATTAPLAWSATDPGTGVDTFDLERQIDGGPFTTELGPTSATSRIASTPVGHTYRFRVRARDRLGNTSGYATTGDLQVITPPCNSCPPPGKRSAGLKIIKVTRAQRRITVQGRLATTTTQRPRVSFRARVNGHVLTKATRPHLKRGRWQAILKLPRGLAQARRGALSVTYDGDAQHRSAAVRRTLRRR